MANKNQEWKPDICIYHDPCDDCGKTFVAYTEYSVDYITITLEESMGL